MHTGLVIVLVGNGITLLLLGIVGTGSDFVATHPNHADNVASGKHVRLLIMHISLLKFVSLPQERCCVDRRCVELADLWCSACARARTHVVGPTARYFYLLSVSESHCVPSGFAHIQG